MEWKFLSEGTPKHKDLVLCWNGDVVLPAIYYNNKSYSGFYFYTTYYHETHPTIYSKVRLKPKHEIVNVVKWSPINEPK
jgi:hypothetical protein